MEKEFLVSILTNTIPAGSTCSITQISTVLWPYHTKPRILKLLIARAFIFVHRVVGLVRVLVKRKALARKQPSIPLLHPAVAKKRSKWGVTVQTGLLSKYTLASYLSANWPLIQVQTDLLSKCHLEPTALS